MSTINDLFTVKEAAQELGVTDARIRQLCITHEIGSMLGRDRVLTLEDMETLKAIPRKVGRPKSEN